MFGMQRHGKMLHGDVQFFICICQVITIRQKPISEDSAMKCAEMFVLFLKK